jgi:CHAD domain-containing protein
MPAARGIRLIALDLLDDTAAAADRLAHGGDDDALHDFRVALRRLRSWFRAFEDELADDVRRKDRRRLREIAAATNAARDVEVQLDWLASPAKGSHRATRRGATRVIEHISTDRPAAADVVDADQREAFAAERRRLEKRLSTYPHPVRVPDTSPPTLADAIASRLGAHVAALTKALGEVTSFDQEAPAHEARIAAKRLRYLVEPAAQDVRGGGRILERLKALQDELGALHDAHVLAHELQALMEPAPASQAGGAPAAGEQAQAAPPRDLRALAARLQADMRAIFARVRDEWLRDDALATFGHGVELFAKRLARTGR